MESIQIGNWLVTNDKIRWVGKEKLNLVIEMNCIGKTGAGERREMFDMLLHISEKDSLTIEDIFYLNASFAYSIKELNIAIPANISWAKTLSEQWRLLHETLPDGVGKIIILEDDLD